MSWAGDIFGGRNPKVGVNHVHWCCVLCVIYLYAFMWLSYVYLMPFILHVYALCELDGFILPISCVHCALDVIQLLNMISCATKA